jgi:hypothetical protein
VKTFDQIKIFEFVWLQKKINNLIRKLYVKSGVLKIAVMFKIMFPWINDKWFVYYLSYGDDVKLDVEFSCFYMDNKSTIIRRLFIYSCIRGHLYLAKFLFKFANSGLDIWTILSETVISDNVCVARFLIKKFGQVEHIMMNDIFCAYFDKSFYKMETVEFLLETGSNIDSSNGYALYNACSDGDLEIVKLLIGRGADIHQGFHRVLQGACRNQNFDIIRFLLDHGSRIEDDYSLNFILDNLDVNASLLKNVEFNSKYYFAILDKMEAKLEEGK